MRSMVMPHTIRQMEPIDVERVPAPVGMTPTSDYRAVKTRYLIRLFY
jgi:hypothetical protein